MILCLEQCEDAEVLAAVLDTLCSLIQNKESLIEEYIQEFLPRLLKLATFKPAMVMFAILSFYVSFNTAFIPTASTHQSIALFTILFSRLSNLQINST